MIPFTQFNLNNLSWDTVSNTMPGKAMQMVGNTGYKIFLQIPYQLTIENGKNALQSKSLSAKVIFAATAVLGSFYTLMLYGSAIHLQGRVAHAIGTKLNSDWIVKAGIVIERLGKNVFLSGAVPLYGIFYEGPKALIQSFPKIAKYVIEKVDLAAQWIFNQVLVPLWEKALLPAIKKIDEAVRYIANIIETAFHKLISTIQSTAKWIFNHIITPLWEKVLLPAIKKIDKVVCYIASNLEAAFLKLISTIKTTAQWIFNHIITPVWEKALLPALKVVDKAIGFVANQVGFALYHAGLAIHSTAQWIFNQCVVPAFNAMTIALNATLNFLSTYVIKPIAPVLTGVCNKISQVAKDVFHHAIIPIALTIRNQSFAIANGIVNAKKEVVEAFCAIWDIFAKA